MSKTSEIRFEKARKRLSLALKDLENAMKEKLHEAAFQSKMIGYSNDDLKRQESLIIEQSATIQNLHLEINNLQKNLEAVGKEADFLNTKNQVLAERFANLRAQGSSLVESITSDLAHIEQLIGDAEE